MQIVYSLHAEEKLGFSEIKKSRVTKKKIEKVLKHPEAIDRSEKPVLIAVGKLNTKLSLCVVYKRIKEGLKIITFYPAERGRYEHKILQRR